MKASKIQFFAALLSVIPLAGACILSGGPEETPSEETEKPSEEDTPTIKTYKRIVQFTSGGWPVSSLDIFLYEDFLIEHRRFEKKDSVQLTLEENKTYKMVAIANAMGKFNEEALRHYDSWESFETCLSDENTDFPIMAISETLVANIDRTVLQLTPLLCTIQIRSVSHLLSDDTLMENPRAYLKNCSSKGKPLAAGLMAPFEQEDSPAAYLPSDIGLYTQYPGMLLYAYPNETASTPTTPPTELILEYEINGQTRRYSRTIHPLERGSYTPVDIVIK